MGFCFLGFGLGGSLLNFKLRDFEGLDSGKKGFHLSVMLAFEVETDLYGDFGHGLKLMN